MKTTFKEKASYGIGAIGKDMVYIIVSSFLMYYYNVLYNVDPAFIGVVFMAARIFDAFNDPFMGILVEKTRTKFGKFRPWLLIGTLSNAVVLYFMFAVPKGIEGTGIMIYLAVMYVLWGVTYTIMDIPFWSMIPAITEAGKDRENVSVIARSCAGVGSAIPTVLTLPIVGMIADQTRTSFNFIPKTETAGFSLVAAVIAIVFVIAELICVKNVKEKNEVVAKAPTIGQMFKSLFTNDQAIVVVVTIILFNASFYLTTSLAIYFFEFDIGNKDLYSLFAMVGGGMQVLSMMFLPLLRKKLTKRQVLIGAVGLTLLGYLYLFILGTLNIANQGLLTVLLCSSAVIIFAGFGLETVLTTIFLADTVDYGEWKTGSRNESVVFSLQTFVVKLASGISVLLAGVGLKLIKLDTEAVTQTEGTITGLRFIMAIIPMIGMTISLIYFLARHKLTEKRLNEINDEVRARNEEKQYNELVNK